MLNAELKICLQNYKVEFERKHKIHTFYKRHVNQSVKQAVVQRQERTDYTHMHVKTL